MVNIQQEFINGITVLSEEAMSVGFLSGWQVAFGIYIIFSCTISGMRFLGDTGSMIGCAFYGIFVIGAIGFLIYNIFAPKDEFIKYEVTVSDEVSFVEFYENYELVEQEV